MTYFLFAVAVLLPVRPLKAAASFSGMLAGVCFIVTLILLPEMQYDSQPNGLCLIMAILNHNLLFTGGMILAGRYPFKKTDLFWIGGWLVLAIACIEVLTHCFGFTQSNAVFTDILDGTIVFQLTGNTFALPWWYYALYYPCCLALLCLLLFLFFKVNKLLQKQAPAVGAQP